MPSTYMRRSSLEQSRAAFRVALQAAKNDLQDLDEKHFDAKIQSIFHQQA